MSYKSFDWEMFRDPELASEKFSTQSESVGGPAQDSPAPIVKTVLN